MTHESEKPGADVIPLRVDVQAAVARTAVRVLTKRYPGSRWIVATKPASSEKRAA